VRQTNGSSLPLASGVFETFFKVLFLDVGLSHSISGVYKETAKKKDLTAIFRGAVAEQFAGQELIACQSPFTKAELYYWGRKAKSSTAELDYLIERDARVVPLEIKSGSTGRMKSLHMFIEKYNCDIAIKISHTPIGVGSQLFLFHFMQ
jgi:predicted AAA+ superfamily ATPase